MFLKNENFGSAPLHNPDYWFNKDYSSKEAMQNIIDKVDKGKDITMREFLLYQINEESKKYGLGLSSKSIKLGKPIDFNG